MSRVWTDLSGTVQAMLKFGTHRIMSYTDGNRVALEERYGNSSLFEVSDSRLQVIGKTVYSASSIPTSGTFAEGDIVINTAMSLNQTLGWICVSGGDPGTWRSITNTSYPIHGTIQDPVANRSYSMFSNSNRYTLNSISLKNVGLTLVGVSITTTPTPPTSSPLTMLQNIGVGNVFNPFPLIEPVVIEAGQPLFISVASEGVLELEYSLNITI